jgi:hypothetical protein
MRILLTIPHYYNAEPADHADGRSHGSVRPDPAPRVAALRACVAALREQFDPAQRIINVSDRTTRLVNEHIRADVDVVICTTKGRHLLDNLVPVEFDHRATESEPMLLGFECQAVLSERLGAYDYYGYLEDDLVVRDPWLFLKLGWFTRQIGDDALLQPNRYEVTPVGLVKKVYLDGELDEANSRPWQDRNDRPSIVSEILGCRIQFHRPSNPHSGCYFLNETQMRAWAARPDFLDRDTSFVGPLESAATLGVMRAFRIYKPAPENAAFLEIEHHGTSFISQLRRRSDV